MNRNKRNNDELRVINFENSIMKNVTPSNNTIIIFCDGACSGNNNRKGTGGWGAVLINGQRKKEIYGGVKNTTNNKMELMACIKSLEEIKSTKYKIIIHSDSAYLVNCFIDGWYKRWERNGWKNHKKEPVKNADLWKVLLSLVRKYDCTFVKVKGHSGNELNERADVLAKKGIDEIRSASNNFYDALAI